MNAQQLAEQKATEALKQIGSLSGDILALEELIVKLQVQLAQQAAEIVELRLEVGSNTRALTNVCGYHE
jgi:hypothetical protein